MSYYYGDESCCDCSAPAMHSVLFVFGTFYYCDNCYSDLLDAENSDE